MCGIAGYSCFKEYDPRLSTAITLLGLYMQERGRRSWGWSDGTQIVKSVGSLEDGWNASFFGYKQAALHTRQPTTGSVIEKNAHPFKIGDIIGMHNGIVHNHEELNKKYNRNCDVDSEHIFHHINDGVALEDIRAYGAVVYWKDGHIHLGRFNNGDLTLVRTEIGFLFASTRGALEKTLRMAGLAKKAIYYKLKEDRLYKLDGDKLEKAGKLNFGSYSKSYGTWDGKTPLQSPNSQTPIRTSSYGTTASGYNYQGWGGAYGGEFVNGKWENRTGGRAVPRIVGAVAGQRNIAVTGSPEQRRLLPTHYQGKQFHSTDDKVKALVLEAAKMVAGTGKDRTDEPAAKCKWCGETIAEGDCYTLSQGMDIMCEECSTRYADESATCWLTELPIEILKVESLFDGNDKMAVTEMVMDCDGCPEQLLGDEYFFHTADNGMLCLQCFINLVGEDEDGEEEPQVITIPAHDVAHPDAQVEAAAQQAIQRRDEEKLNNLIAEMDESPAAAALAKADKEAWGDELMQEVTAGMMSKDDKKKVTQFIPSNSRLVN
jgi:hypothetical protein